MDDAVQQAAAYAESDDTVLLAPACASLDQYENYAARGDAFVEAVGAIRR
jgi:UDP-N-acetylmuramoylalanine--D-glutamate ligase